MLGQIATFCALICWGFWGFASYQAVQRTHPLNVQWVIAIPYVILAPLWYTLARRVESAQMPDRLAVFWGVMACLGSVLGSYFYNQALKSGKAALVVSISSAYPLITVFLLVAIGAEKFQWQQGIGMLCIIVGVVILQLYN